MARRKTTKRDPSSAPYDPGLSLPIDSTTKKATDTLRPYQETATLEVIAKKYQYDKKEVNSNKRKQLIVPYWNRSPSYIPAGTIHRRIIETDESGPSGEAKETGNETEETVRGKAGEIESTWPSLMIDTRYIAYGALASGSRRFRFRFLNDNYSISRFSWGPGLALIDISLSDYKSIETKDSQEIHVEKQSALSIRSKFGFRLRLKIRENLILVVMEGRMLRLVIDEEP